MQYFVQFSGVYREGVWGLPAPSKYMVGIGIDSMTN